MLKKTILFVLIAGGVCFYFFRNRPNAPAFDPVRAGAASVVDPGDARAAEVASLIDRSNALINGQPVATREPQNGSEGAFQNYRSGEMITAEGVVDGILPDDNDGSRHQRFIIRLASGQTLLVAHNIDLSIRIPIAAASHVKLHGQFEWNDKGGVVHWTHRDPQQHHEAGWIETGGRTYD